MAISIGDAMLRLGVDTKDLDKGLQGIGNTIKKHQKAIGIGMVAAGGAILAAGALSIKTFAEMGDEVQKLALKTGFSTEALSEWRHAAEISGASLETLEKGVKRMSTSIIDAQDGLLESVRNFDKLGIAVEDLQGLSPEEQFEKIAFAISKLEDPTLRAAIAQKIFGRAGTELLPLLAAGKEGIAELRKETHELGIVFDQEAANKAAELTDAMHRIEEATQGVKMTIASQLLPVLLPLITKIKEAVIGMSAWAKEHPGLTKVIVLGTVALGSLLLVLGTFLLIMPGITAATAAFGITLSAAIWPITLVALGIAGLIAIGVLLWENWDTLKRKTVETWEGIKMFFLGVWVSIRDIFEKNWKKVLGILFPAVGVGMLISQEWDSILAYFGRVWTSVKEIFIGVGEAMWGPIKAAADKILRYISGIIAALNALRDATVGTIGGAIGGGTPSGVTGLAAGGIAMRPITRRIAEREPEAVIPLSKLGSMGGTANIFVELDGRVIGQAVGVPLVDEIRLRTGVHI